MFQKIEDEGLQQIIKNNVKEESNADSILKNKETENKHLVDGFKSK